MLFPGVAVITGAASGIGRATAKLFAKQGCARIVIGDRDTAGLKETRKQIQDLAAQGEVQDLQFDVTSEQSVENFFKKATSAFGRLDYACNVAGILMAGSSPEISVADFDKQQSINVRGTWLCQRAELIQMLKQTPLTHSDSPFAPRGSIANVSSMCGLRAYDNLPAYCASKHSIIGFTKADAMRYAVEGIRLNAICPGVIATPMLGEIDEDDTTSIGDMTKDIYMGRQGRPEEIAEALLWITSARASFVTSTTLAVNGGMVGA